MTVQSHAAPPARTLARALQAAGAQWVRVSAVLLLDVLRTPLTLLTPVPLAIVVDSVLGDEPPPALLRALLPDAFVADDRWLLLTAASMLVLVVLAEGVRNLLRVLIGTRGTELMTLETRTGLFRHAQRLSLSYHDQRGTTDAVYRIQYDAMSMATIAFSGLIPVVTTVVTLAVMLAVIATLSVPLLLVALGVTPPLYVLAHHYNRRARLWHRQVKRVESEAMGVVAEVISALRVVKAFNREDYEQERFVARSAVGLRTRVRLAVAESVFSGGVSLLTVLGSAAVLLVGVGEVRRGSLSLGQLLLVYSYLAQLYEPLKELSRRLASLQSALVSAERVFEVLDMAPDVTESPHPRRVDRLQGAVELRRASFCFSPTTRALDAVSFRVAPGTRVGISGHSGAGKSTLIALLMRLYDPDEGRVLLDGVDARDYAVRDLREQFAVVPQDPVLFAASIAENIAYAKPDASPAEIEAAALAAGAHQFIAGLSQGYDTVVGERGMRLSGGERQRIALARAFLKDAPILILDEPTSSVDMATEAQIMAAMDRLMQGRTTFMIAHRLPTLDHCSARLVLAGGRLIDSAGEIDATLDEAGDPASRLPAPRSVDRPPSGMLEAGERA